LREATEEIGLDPSLVDVVTVLEPFMTKVRLCSIKQIHFLVIILNHS
jgi:coenzyme A diphosphatase NUDT7